MTGRLKIGIQNLHPDEFITLKELFNVANVEIYEWHSHNYVASKILECDYLILFARRHWRYLKFGKPYLLILADYVSDEKAISLSMNRRLGLFGYSYTPNEHFKGYLCGSGELHESIIRAKLSGMFYPKRYPFSELFARLQQRMGENDPHDIVTLINNYRTTASERKWNRPENCFTNYETIVREVTQFKFALYGTPDNMKSFDESNEIQARARYTIHVKYWGHVCNAVVKSLALGTPVIMDETTFNKGRYKSYVRHNDNGLVFKSTEQIVRFLQSKDEADIWHRLKSTCMREAGNWHFPYPETQKSEWMNLLGELPKQSTESVT